MYTVKGTPYSVRCTVYSVRCTVYSVQCTVYTVPFIAGSGHLDYGLGVPERVGREESDCIITTR